MGGVWRDFLVDYLFDALLRSTLRLHRYRSRRSCAMSSHESRLIPMTLLRGFRLVPTDSSSKKLYQMLQDYNGFRDFEALDSFTKASVGTGWDDWREKVTGPVNQIRVTVRVFFFKLIFWPMDESRAPAPFWSSSAPLRSQVVWIPFFLSLAPPSTCPCPKIGCLSKFQRFITACHPVPHEDTPIG